MKIDSYAAGQFINISAIQGEPEGMADIFSRLNVGEVIKAQILEIINNELILKLMDGTSFKAVSTVDLNVSKGQNVEFLVTDKSDGQVFLAVNKKNIAASLPEDKILKFQLKELGVKPARENIDIANELKSRNIPLAKPIIENAADILLKFKNTDVPKAVFIASNNLKAEEKTIASLLRIADPGMKIWKQLDNILHSIIKTGNSELIGNIEKALVSASKETSVEYSNFKDSAGDQKSVLNNTAENLIKSLGLESTLKEFMNTAASKSSDLTNTIKSFLNSIPDMKGKLTSEQTISLTEYITAKTIESDNNIAEKGTAIEIELLQQNSTEKKAEGPEEKHGDLLFKVFEKYHMDTSSLRRKEDVDVKNLYKDVYLKLEVIKDKVSNSNIASREDLTVKIDNLQQDILLLNEINRHTTYLQIPIYNINSTKTAELFVLKRESKRKKINPEDTVMLISLDTENLGRIDSLISVNKKNVSLKIRVEDRSIIDFIKENYRHLHSSLISRGYRLVDIKYRLIDEAVDIFNVDEIIEKEMKADSVSLDLRI